MSEEELRNFAREIADLIFNNKELLEQYMKLREEIIRRKRLQVAIFVEIIAISDLLSQRQQVR